MLIIQSEAIIAKKAKPYEWNFTVYSVSNGSGH